MNNSSLWFCFFYYICFKINIMARPSEYSFEMCKDICAEVANGSTIKSVLNSKEEYPTCQTWCNWKRQNTELFDLYTRSIQDKADSVEEEMESIYEKIKTGELDPSTGRLLMDTLKWKAAKYYPKMFGDKIDHTTQGEKINTTPTIVFKKYTPDGD